MKVTVAAAIASACPTGTYTVTVTLMGNDGTGAEASQAFQIQGASQQSPPALPTMKIDGLLETFNQGTEELFNIVFESLETDPNSVQYSYRADVVDDANSAADGCEGTGLGGTGPSTASLSTSDQSDGEVTVAAAIALRLPNRDIHSDRDAHGERRIKC